MAVVATAPQLMPGAVRVDKIYEAIATEKVSHFCSAPIVLNMINNAPTR